MKDPIEDFHTRWIVREHTIPASHIRGFARGVRTDGPHAGAPPRLRLAVKQYVPMGNPRPRPGDPTVLVAHGVGSSKEAYEPFVDALARGLRLRAVWIPDVAWHGASYRLNHRGAGLGALGDEPHWDDAARDLLHLANHLQADMPPPLLGVAQSWGAWALARAASWHPRLFAGLALVEPTLVASWPARPARAAATARGMLLKRDRWPSRAAARAYLRRNPYYGAFDPDVFERVVRYELRDVDDDDDGGDGDGDDDLDVHDDDGRPVTLTTPKAMEVYTMMRPWPPLPSSPASDPDRRLERLAASGLHDPDVIMPGFHRPEAAALALADLRPPVQLVWAGRGFAALLPGYREWLLGAIGTGRDGSGGAPEGKVVEAVVEDSGHPLPLEHPRDAAAVVGPWLEARAQEWRDEAEQIRRGPPQYIAKVNPEWVEKASKL